MIRVLVVIAVVILLLASCGVRRAGPRMPVEETSATGPIFDPLASPEDRIVVPEKYPVRVAVAPDAADSLASSQDMIYSEFDSDSSLIGPAEVYRVQVFTSRLYAEANRELLLAEEIFNLPVYLDYEVPYYKLRVGDFTSRDEAENMIPEIKAIGYSDAWVARVVFRIKELPEPELQDQPVLPDLTPDSLGAPPDSADGEKWRDKP